MAIGGRQRRSLFAMQHSACVLEIALPSNEEKLHSYYLMHSKYIKDNGGCKMQVRMVIVADCFGLGPRDTTRCMYDMNMDQPIFHMYGACVSYVYLNANDG